VKVRTLATIADFSASSGNVIAFPRLVGDRNANHPIEEMLVVILAERAPELHDWYLAA